MGGGSFSPNLIARIGGLLGYRKTWMADTRQTLESELRSRGIAPQDLPGPEMPAAAPHRASRSTVLIRWLIGVFVAGIAAWLFYKIGLG
jgi:hypothetical protein